MCIVSPKCVRILNLNYGETVFGNITIRALIYGSENYTVQVLINGTEIGDSIPVVWNSSTVDDGWWNTTVIVSDVASGTKWYILNTLILENRVCYFEELES